MLARLALVPLALLLTQCAPLFTPASAAKNTRVFVGPSEQLFLRTQAFDSTARAELTRGGVDPEAFEREFREELAYRFALRGQEEARDSAGARVLLDVTVRHLQPGAGSVGIFGAFTVRSLREGKEQRTDWEWRVPSRQNVADRHAARHLARATADEILKRIPPARPVPKEPPPPLSLF